MYYQENGNRYSEPSIYPRFWQNAKQKDLNLIWRVQYWYYLQDGSRKLITIKSGVNRLKDLQQRKEAIKALLDQEMELLSAGYNPVSKNLSSIEVFEKERLTLSFTDALSLAAEKYDCVHSTRLELKAIVRYLREASQILGNPQIKNIKKRNVIQFLNYIKEERNLSNDRYNKMRSYLSMLFKWLVENDLIKKNPVLNTSKKKTIRKLRKVLSAEQQKIILTHLKDHHFNFWRYVIIFFYAGSRTTELFRLQKNIL